MGNVRLVTIDENNENFLKVRFIDRSDKNYQHDPLHMYAKKAPAAFKHQIVLSSLPGEVYSVEANDKIPDGCRYPFSIIQAFNIKASSSED